MKARFFCNVVVLGMLLVSAQSQQASPEGAKRAHKRMRLGMPGQISERIAHTKGNVYLSTFQAPPVTIGLPPAAQVENLACSSDLVVIGRTLTATSYAAEDDSYVYTDWQFSVEEIFKNNYQDAVAAGGVITITRPGGVVEVQKRKVYALQEGFRGFRRGERLLLFLRYDPEAKTYIMATATGFSLDDRVRPLGKGVAEPELEEPGDLLRITREGIAATNKNSACQDSRQ